MMIELQMTKLGHDKSWKFWCSDSYNNCIQSQQDGKQIGDRMAQTTTWLHCIHESPFSIIPSFIYNEGESVQIPRANLDGPGKEQPPSRQRK